MTRTDVAPAIATPSARESRIPETRLITSSKVQDHHQQRLAVVYVRQSTPRQVIEHRESTLLQYQLTERAEFYGWRKDRILVVDDDLGKSGRSIEGRVGFQHLLAEVGLDHVGLVLGIEMSRLARSCKDWHQLLELCALFRCLLADQDGLYDPSDFNDRLLLGLKGTMSEAELHILKGRMQQGSWNKARRGELITTMPVGYTQTFDGEVTLEPDEQARAVVRLVFDKFDELGSAMAVLRYLLAQDLRLPIRAHSGPLKGQLEWREPMYSTIAQMLNNPTYAGAYTYGRHQRDPRRAVAGKPQSGRFVAKREDWKVLIQDKFPAYISWDQYLAHVKQLQSNRSFFDSPGVPREGPALLSGILFCGRCGRRMAPHYKGGTKPAAYFCMGAYPAQGTSTCQRLSSRFVDDLIAQQVQRAMEPAVLELSLDASERIRRERQQLHAQWKLKLERASFQADRVRRQYDAVEPENRLVARELERRWEQGIVEQQQLQEEYSRYQRDLPEELSPADLELIRSLSTDIPALWNAETTSRADRQTIVRHLVERVVVAIQGRSERFDLTIHWQGGFVSQHEVRRAVAKYGQLQNFDQLQATVTEHWRSGRTTTEIAASLNCDGFRTPQGKTFNRHIVRKLLDTWNMTEPQRAQISGALATLATHEWWLLDLSRKLSIDSATLTRWCRRGWIHARKLPGRCSWWVVWADDDECSRLQRLYAHGRGFPRHNGSPYPLDLKTPKPKPAADSIRGQ